MWSESTPHSNTGNPLALARGPCQQCQSVCNIQICSGQDTAQRTWTNSQKRNQPAVGARSAHHQISVCSPFHRVLLKINTSQKCIRVRRVQTQRTLGPAFLFMQALVWSGCECWHSVSDDLQSVSACARSFRACAYCMWRESCERDMLAFRRTHSIRTAYSE